MRRAQEETALLLKKIGDAMSDSLTVQRDIAKAIGELQHAFRSAVPPETTSVKTDRLPSSREGPVGRLLLKDWVAQARPSTRSPKKTEENKHWHTESKGGKKDRRSIQN